jgi:hypothetical protein
MDDIGDDTVQFSTDIPPESTEEKASDTKKEVSKEVLEQLIKYGLLSNPTSLDELTDTCFK